MKRRQEGRFDRLFLCFLHRTFSKIRRSRERRVLVFRIPCTYHPAAPVNTTDQSCFIPSSVDTFLKPYWVGFLVGR